MEEVIWRNLSYPDIVLKFIFRKITEYVEEERVIRIEYRYIDDQIGTVYKYHYDSYGKMIKETIIFNDDLLGYYTANYSDEDSGIQM